MLSTLSLKFDRVFIESIKKVQKKFDLGKCRNDVRTLCPACHTLINFSFNSTGDFLHTGKTEEMKCASCGCMLFLEINVKAPPAESKEPTVCDICGCSFRRSLKGPAQLICRYCGKEVPLPNPYHQK